MFFNQLEIILYVLLSMYNMVHRQNFECHAINTHSYLMYSNTTSKLTTNTVPNNMFIFMLGSLGKYTKDPENENLGKKWTSGIDTQIDGDAYNAPIHHWLKNKFAAVGELPMQEYGDVAIFAPGTTYPDRVLAPDKDAVVPGTLESESMKYFTETGEESFSLLLTQIERNELGEKNNNYGRRKMREAAKRAVANGLRSDAKAVMHLDFSLSRLCNYISKHNPDRTILLLVLGCQVIPTEINLSLKSYSGLNTTHNYEIWLNILKSIRIGREVISKLPRGKRERRVNISPDIGPKYWGIVHPDDDREERGWHSEKTITRWKKEVVSVLSGKREYNDKIYYDLIDTIRVSKREKRIVNLLVRKIIKMGNNAPI